MSEIRRAPKATTWVNWLLIIIGILVIGAALIRISPDLMKSVVPPDIAQQLEAEEMVERIGALTGQDSVPHLLAYGVFAFVAGVGLFKRRGWAWGMAFVIVSMLVLTTIVGVLMKLPEPRRLELASYAFWVQVLAGFVAIVVWFGLIQQRKTHTG